MKPNTDNHDLRTWRPYDKILCHVSPLPILNYYIYGPRKFNYTTYATIIRKEFQVPINFKQTNHEKNQLNMSIIPHKNTRQTILKKKRQT